MKKIELKSRQLLRAIFGSFSVTAMAFIFQACYGMAPDKINDVRFSGTVKSKGTKQPVKGIKVAVNDEHNFGFTDEKGAFDFYAYVPYRSYGKDSTRYAADSVTVRFLDVDGAENGHFTDTAININPTYEDQIIVNMELEEKE
jgi:hypothetical protein